MITRTPYDEPDPPTRCRICRRDLAGAQDLFGRETDDATWQRFYARNCVCDACHARMEARGVRLCTTCDAPTAIDRLINNACPVCRDFGEDEATWY